MWMKMRRATTFMCRLKCSSLHRLWNRKSSDYAQFLRTMMRACPNLSTGGVHTVHGVLPRIVHRVIHRVNCGRGERLLA